MSLPRSRIHPFRRRLSKCSSRYGPAAIRRSAHLKGGWGTRLKVVETWFVVLSVSDLIPVLRRFRAPRHERNYAEESPG